MSQEQWRAEFTGWTIEGGLGSYTMPGPFLVKLERDGAGRKDSTIITAYLHMGGGEGNWRVLDKNLKGIKDFDHMAATVTRLFQNQETPWRKTNAS